MSSSDAGSGAGANDESPQQVEVEKKKKKRLSFKGASKLIGRVMGTSSKSSKGKVAGSSSSSNDGDGSQESKTDVSDATMMSQTTAASGNTEESNVDQLETIEESFRGSTLQEIADEDVELNEVRPVNQQEQLRTASMGQPVVSHEPSENIGRKGNENSAGIGGAISGGKGQGGEGGGRQHDEYEWSTEKAKLQRDHANEKALLLEENISLKRMLGAYDKASGGQLNFKATYDELSHMRAKVGVLEKELVNTHVVVDKLQRDVELLHTRLMLEREERGHLEQYYKEKINQYVEYLESKHFLSRENMSAELGAAAVLSIDDFLRLSAEADPMSVQANLAATASGQADSKAARGRGRGGRASPSDGDGGASSATQRSRSESPFGHRGWRTVERELSMYAAQGGKRKKKREKPDGPTSNLIVMAENAPSPSASAPASASEHKFKVTHKVTSPEVTLSRSKAVTPWNIMRSPPSLKQTIRGPRDDYVRPVGRGRNCAVHEPEYGTIFVETNHQIDNCGMGENVNTKLVKKYEKMGHWASFTSSAKFKLKPAMEPIIGSRGLDDGPLFKLK